jgi:hypothetical protein
MGPTDRDFDDADGWIWTVYPVHSSDPMVAVGHSGNGDKAREQVEHSLLSAAHSAFGVVIGPRGEQELCRRNGDGGFAWRPLPLDVQ